MSLPTSRHFVTQLLNSLPSSSSNTDTCASPLSAVPESAKKQLLSLQVLFPNEFLPALDLLDRGLVTRLTIGDGKAGDSANVDGSAGEVQDEDGQAAHTMADTTNTRMDRPAVNHSRDSESDTVMTDVVQPAPEQAPSTTSHDCTYYVQSAQQRSSRYSSSYDTTTSYEVRLRAWNCSCPAFAFAAFPAVHPEPAIPTYNPNDDVLEDMNDGIWVFGGVSLGDAIPPVCKHLLACVLVEKCSGLFGSFIQEKMVSVEEAAGWAAGWGD